jgi:NitT/TauT family transport system substrate-binding protein
MVFTFGGRAEAMGSADRQSQPLRFGIMPDADSLPFMVARDEGCFAKEGVNVELDLFQNPQARDAALQAGKIDGTISDVLAAAFLAAGKFDAKITSYTDGRYGLVASKASGVTTVAGLEGKKIALSANTIIQYSADEIFIGAGLPMGDYDAVSVPQMPLRVQMVVDGQIDGACLPEPLLTAAAGQGATLISTTDDLKLDAGVIVFTGKALDSRLNDLKAFYRAYWDAAQKINASPDAYRDYLVEKAGFPEAVKSAYQFEHYRKPGLPAPDQITKALDWLSAKKLLNAALNPAAMMDGRAISE